LVAAVLLAAHEGVAVGLEEAAPDDAVVLLFAAHDGVEGLEEAAEVVL
jgi:hypothetical protein